MTNKNNISRRDFLKLSALGLGAAAFRPAAEIISTISTQVGSDGKIGRVCVGSVNLRMKPDADSASIKTLYEDHLIVWQRDVVGKLPSGLLNRKWVETPEGYVYAGSVQPVKNLPNVPYTVLPSDLPGGGFWVEVTVPFVDLVQANPPASSPWLKEVKLPRLYYSQILWVDNVKTSNDGKLLYHISERYGSYGDTFWALAEGFRPITSEEVAPISPEVEEKRIDVSVPHQTLSCYEGNREVYFCRISSGAKYDAYGKAVDNWLTPVGPQRIWRKLVSIHMSGGGTGAGWDTPGIGWTCLFNGEGVAIHSTFWHNVFGEPRSHGCVNATPEDAKWIFRWTTPAVDYDPGDITVPMPGGTIVNVIDG
ncbi:MAG: L,D-transpeptidase family protein [Anaerolineaceae bacterium]